MEFFFLFFFLFFCHSGAFKLFSLSSPACRRGTIFDIQKVLKTNYAPHLDKYKIKGHVQWKKAVRDVLNEEKGLFQAAGKTASGKIMWTLIRGDDEMI